MGLFGAIIGGTIGLISGGMAAKAEKDEKAEKYKTLMAQYDLDRKNALAASKINFSNATSLLDTGKDAMEQSTFQSNKMVETFGQADGQNQLAIGRSAVNMEGSAKGLINYNYQNMGEDLNQMMKNADSTWRQTMAQRESELISGHNQKDAAATYLSLYNKYARDLGDIGRGGGWGIFTSFIQGAATGAMLPI